MIVGVEFKTWLSQGRGGVGLEESTRNLWGDRNVLSIGVVVAPAYHCKRHSFQWTIRLTSVYFIVYKLHLTKKIMIICYYACTSIHSWTLLYSSFFAFFNFMLPDINYFLKIIFPLFPKDKSLIFFFNCLIFFLPISDYPISS